MSVCLTELSPPPVAGVRIWSAQLDALSENQLARLSDSLDLNERERAGRFHFERDRRHYVAARGLLRELIGTALDLSPASVQFTYGARGKPALACASESGTGLRFNLSHSSGWAMFALTTDREVGVDLEAATRLASDEAHLSGLAARVLSERELEIWRALPESSRPAAFLRAWTRKEAYGKATGDGIFDRLREIEVILDAHLPQQYLAIRKPSTNAPNGWALHDLPAPEGFVAAVAVALI